MQDKVFYLISEQLNVPVEKITLSSRMVEDLGADSLDMVEMMMTLEEEFGLTIADEEATKLKTVDDIVNFIKNNGK